MGILWGSAAPAAPLVLELPTLSAEPSRFFRLADWRGTPVLINVWDADCPPCLRELPLLAASAQARPDWHWLGITLSGKTAALRWLADHPLPYPQLRAPADAAALLRRLGDPHGAVPHTVVLDAAHEICASHTGEIDRAWLEAALKRCSGPAKVP